MKLCTYWWGIHLVSESEEETELLKKLYERLEAGSTHAYEEGDVELYIPYEATHSDFWTHYTKGETVLEIAR